METWKIYVLFRNGKTLTQYFNTYIEAVQTYVDYWSNDVVKAVLEKVK